MSPSSAYCRYVPRQPVAVASGPIDFASLGLDIDIPDIDGDLKSVQTELGATFDVRWIGQAYP